VPEPRRYRFVQFDVFSARPLEGNPLAVFPDARGLSDAELQALAREMNLSETTFVLPRELEVERAQGTRVRIFTVEEELPFAGHPTLGTAFYLRGASGADQVWLDLNVGKIPISFSDHHGTTFGEMRQRDPEFGQTHAREDVARLAGLKLDDLDPALPIQTVSTGIAFAIVPLRTLEAIRNLHLDLAAAQKYFSHRDAKFFYFVTRDTVNHFARLHARMLFYNGEDPATGSAAGCAAAWMAAHRVAESGERVLIEQGIECRRPSQIWVTAERAGDRVINVRVGGNAVEVARGEMFL
jgi:trans-2,3-dihydro-3-hydroxyanthranilate isomerase